MLLRRRYQYVLKPLRHKPLRHKPLRRKPLRRKPLRHKTLIRKTRALRVRTTSRVTGCWPKCLPGRKELEDVCGPLVCQSRSNSSTKVEWIRMINSKVRSEVDHRNPLDVDSFMTT